MFDYLNLPPITDAEITAAVYANGSNDLIPRDVLEDLKAAKQVIDRNITGLDLVKALEATGFHEVAENLLTVLRQRVSGDLLQTSAILDDDLKPLSAINDCNDYAGPGTGYRPSGARWEQMKRLRHVTSASNPEQELP